MSRSVTYNGKTYRWSGKQWLDTVTYMPPPGVVQQELNHRFHRDKVKANRKATQRKKTKAIQETIGPIIVDYIQRQYVQTNEFVHRDDIAAYLLSHPEACSFLQEAYAKTDQKHDFEWYVGNQVDWLSANYGNPNCSEVDHLLEKAVMPDGKKGYRPKQRTSAPYQKKRKDHCYCAEKLNLSTGKKCPRCGWILCSQNHCLCTKEWDKPSPPEKKRPYSLKKRAAK